jgi:hypothetical protein
MDPVAYTVTATFTKPELVSRYIAWLAGGHVKAVCDAGALSALVVVLDATSGELPTLEVRYLFPDRETLDRYFTDHAPRLRAEGLALFGPETGTRFTRSTGAVAHVETKQ